MKKLMLISMLGLFAFIGNLNAQTTTETTATSTLTSEGFELYDAHKYKEAIVVFNKAVKENPKDGKAFYYRGMSKMHDGQKGFCKDLEESLTLGYSKNSDIYYYGCKTNANK